MSLEHILLGLLGEPASGYELKQAFDEAIRHFWSADMAQIYRTLQRLENEGLLRSTEKPSDKGPAKRVYQRTAAGRKKLLQWLKSEPQFGTERFAYVGQLVFMHELDDPESTLKFMRQLRDKFRSTLVFFKHMEKEETQKNEQEMSGEEFFGYLGLRMGIRSLAARIRWCDEAIQKINERYSK